jgi:hypothetical protein
MNTQSSSRSSSSHIIHYNCFNGEFIQKDSLDLKSILKYLPVGKQTIFTNIRTHCWDDDEFIIEVVDRKIINTEIIEEINKYLVQNNSRSFFYEGLVSRGYNSYELRWSS